MKQIKYISILIMLLSTITVSCQNNNSTQKDNFNITVSDLKEAIKNDPNLVILDVRTPQELVGEHGKIDGVINIPIQVLSKRVSELEPYRDKNIAVICRSGNRSAIGTKILLEHGYKAKNVEGGMKAYNKIK